ncbi:MAG: hypothetical protein ACKVPJ_07285 [Chitinophagales bacterium]
MKNFIKKHFEIILLINTIVFVFFKPNMQQFGERISMIMFGTLAFFYLASGVMVFLDKQRVNRSIRLIYMMGLWAVAMTVIGVMARIALIQMSFELLVICVSSLIGILIYTWMNYTRIEKEENKKAFAYFLQPLVLRCILAIFIGGGFLLMTNYAIYNTFGTNRRDPVYVQKVVNAYENPQDTVIVNDFKAYDETKRNTVTETNKNGK